MAKHDNCAWICFKGLAKRRFMYIGILMFSFLQLLVYQKAKSPGGNVLIQNGKLSIKLQGRLGNQMFQYASILGLGDMMDFINIVIEDVRDELLSSFQLSDNRVSFSRLPRNGKYAKERLNCAFDKRLTMFSNKEDVNVVGYLQSWKYFHGIENHIRKEFTFVPSILSKAQKVKLDIASQFNDTSTLKNRTYIGVHIRRGDFLQERFKKAGHYTVTKEYIFHALQLCTRMFGENAIFVFCSDDISWVKDNFSKNTNKWKMAFVEGNPAAVDMAVLSLCDHTIVTTGSFGWWAAWLAGGKTIISKQQAKHGSYLSAQFIYSDYFYPDWIVID
ncbi:galactoside alpha-(1,2)-fucosyltransferase 2-like [Dreissena polymorpha]|uniref:L-Fucosyltransferase n=1 Tax=Dreissena polymorpha TaxID=45954 RepID=A0A9D4IAU9_DREPO|nr:galactoside alpha-(1,2)-fucosyltransferase 2-like [Dreissena polymorpha]KAH3753308.1 hypothetical protein DPMN_187943 [Dreissena polymorpha]